MKALGPVLTLLKIGRLRDWSRFRWQAFRAAGTVTAEKIPHTSPGFRLTVKPNATLRLGRDVRFNENFTCYLEEGCTVAIGDRTLFNVGCWISASDEMVIGADCLFAPMVTIVDSDHRFEVSATPFSRQGFEKRSITIGDNVWIGAKGTVMQSIGANSVIGANAVVNRPVPARSIAVGVPARVIGSVPVAK